ncbi:MAG TPA: IS4 family transposase, partial [Flavisolibacter sp.]|nr:IS4 family transposase [Flavisolibacter sp.]
MAAVTFVNRGFKKKISRELAKDLRRKTAFEDKESYLWYSTIVDAVKNCPQMVRKTVVADRAADIYPVLTNLDELGVDYVVRSCHNRSLEQGNKLYEQVSTFSEQYRFSVLLPATDKRSAHTAVLKLRYGQVTLKRNEAKTNQPVPLTHTCWAVKVEEDSCSVVGKEAPVEWLLLTSHPVQSPEQAMQVIGFYKERWNIEQVFRVLKTKGLCFEQCQVKEYRKLQKLMMVALMAAVKVLQLVRARDGRSGQSASCAFSQTEMVVV